MYCLQMSLQLRDLHQCTGFLCFKTCDALMCLLQFMSYAASAVHRNYRQTVVLPPPSKSPASSRFLCAVRFDPYSCLAQRRVNNKVPAPAMNSSTAL